MHLRRVRQTGKSDDERHALARDTNQKHFTTAQVFDEVESGQSGQKVDGREDTANDQRQRTRTVQRVFKQNGSVVNGSVTAGELLHKLGG